MKTRFTKSISKAILSFCILSMASIGGLHAQNNWDGSKDQNGGAYPAKVVSGKHIFINTLYPVKDLKDNGSTVGPAIDPQSYQFDLGQTDLGELYKLLDLYKSETGKGPNVGPLKRKNQSGNAVDSIHPVFKYVVADDLAGFAPIANSVEPPVIIGARFNNTTDMISSGNDQVSNSAIAGVAIIQLSDLSDHVSLYPNPAQNFITVDMGNLSESSITVYNIQGKLVKSIPSSIGISQQKIDIADLPSGFYVLNINSPNGQAVKKFSKIN